MTWKETHVQGVSIKFQDFGHKKFILQNLRILQAFTFEVLSVESHTLLHSFLPSFYTIPEGFFRDAFELRRRGLLDGFHIYKMCPF